MTFSYTAGSTSDLTRVRLLIGDTDSEASAQERLEDEEITDILTMFGGFRPAAAAAADALAGKFATKATSKSLGRASLQWQRFEQLRKLAESLRAGAALTAVPFAGGLSISRRQNNEADTDLVQPAIKRGMLDNPPLSESTTS